MIMAAPTTCRRGEQACNAFSKCWNLLLHRGTPSIGPKLPRTSFSNRTSDTILYLAYGSNLSAETFKGNRGIKPLSAVNVHVPSLSLVFDLAGIPYIEPCFANTCYRNPSFSSNPTSEDYHKDRWQKGLIGVVYEVTPEDYRTIIATEGGGASYQDVVVDCYELSEGGKTANPIQDGAPFKAHTLLSPTDNTDNGGRVSRPDPSYAQASVRYLKLITDGAEEHSLPDEYLAYLHNLRPYRITTYRQRIGMVLFLGIWAPFLAASMGLSRMLADEEGRVPGWLAKAMRILFQMVWGSYDIGFKKVFGDGERTIEREEDEERRYWGDDEKSGARWCQKTIRLENS
jgi:hypothetical protein